MIDGAFAAGGGVGGFAAGTHGGDCLAKSVNVACGNDKTSFGRDSFGAPASVSISCDWRSAGERFDVDGRKIIFVSWVDKQICLVVKRDEFVNILRAFDAANALRKRGDLFVGQTHKRDLQFVFRKAFPQFYKIAQPFARVPNVRAAEDFES